MTDNHLWAPWRMEYILCDRDEECIFCSKVVCGDDARQHILQRGVDSFAMLNLYPYNNGHIMVAPYAHIASLEELPGETLAEMMILVRRGMRVLRASMYPDGFNVGINIGKVAGAGIIDHVHIHVVPRWRGDTNFMPVTAGVRVIPEMIDATYEKLKAAWDELGEQEE